MENKINMLVKILQIINYIQIKVNWGDLSIKILQIFHNFLVWTIKQCTNAIVPDSTKILFEKTLMKTREWNSRV